MTDFEKRIKTRWAEADIKSLVDFSNKIGISDNSMRLIFKKEDCKLSLLLKMCEVLKCTPNDLTGY